MSLVLSIVNKQKLQRKENQTRLALLRRNVIKES